MQFLDLTLQTPAHNVALDEALLEEAEHVKTPLERLRIWEAAAPIVVIGRSSCAAQELNLDACRRDGVPVLRRASGGAAIVTGPGCLMYAVILSYPRWPGIKTVDGAHRLVLEKLGSALRAVAPDVQCCGTSDLAMGGLKFSGNSLRLKRTHLLYHGTLLYDFPLDLVSRYLKQPPREPDYRRGRTHDKFVCNLPASREQLSSALLQAWQATEPCRSWPAERLERLVAEKYSKPHWNLNI